MRRGSPAPPQGARLAKTGGGAAGFQKWAQKAGPAAKKTGGPPLQRAASSRTLAALSAAETVIPFIKGGDAEHTLVVLQRLQLDAAKEFDNTAGAHVDVHATFLTRELAMRDQTRKQIDLSYLPEGRDKSDQGKAQPTSLLGKGLEMLFSSDKQELGTCQDRTLANLKAQVNYLKQWGEALHNYEVLPATGGSPMRSPSLAPSAFPSASKHSRTCDHMAEVAGMSPQEVRKKEQERRRAERQGRETWLTSQASLTCPAGLGAVEQKTPAGLRKPVFSAPAGEREWVDLRLPEHSEQTEEILRETEEPRRKKFGGADEDLLAEDLDEEEQQEIDQMHAEQDNRQAAAGHVGVKEMIEFFETTRIPASQRVKMLELDCRSLLTTIKKLRSEKAAAQAQLREAQQAKEEMARNIETRERLVQQKAAAIRLALKDHLRIQRALQASVASGSQIIEEEQKKVAAVRRSEAQISQQMEQVSVIADHQAEELKVLRKKLEDTKKEYEAREAKEFLDQKAYRQDQIKLEKYHYRCLSLGEDRIRLLEAVRRERANLDLRTAEALLYKHHLEEMTAERGHFYDAAQNTRKKAMEEKVEYQKRLQDELEKSNQMLSAKDRELAAEREQRTLEQRQTAKLRTKSAMTLHQLKEMKSIIDTQQEQLKSQSSNFQEFVKNLETFHTKLDILDRIVQNLRTYYLQKKAVSGGSPLARQQFANRRKTERETQNARTLSFRDDDGPRRRGSARPDRIEISEEERRRAFEEAAEGQPQITAEKAAQAARKLGLAPSLADVETLHKNLTGAGVDPQTFAKFCHFCARSEDEGEQLATFFKAWDPTESGFISKAAAKNILRSFGEPLTEEEADFAIRVLADDADRINYREFCDK
ncbi:hypothetical protein BESB_029240 [Besnoitia besnoiti]|uniref:Calmodulin n=1 Tax=Besnoitia besnoiti TaxID=94643 RepID=A0A2A9M0K9_BESBE|nr:uncharacterized protein BESB_029240 [Besnoitia besnoiti]PFH31489.1 hypothetical protein BESB_029240 [Besnoitia besnoiti]